MPIITVGTSKGGAGKSTLCTNLIIQHLAIEPDTAMIDADPQRSTSIWAAVRESKERTPGILSFEKTGPDFGKQVLRLNEKYPTVFIDVAGRNSSELRSAALISDILVLPLRPSNFDVWALAEDMTMVRNSRLQNPELKVLIVYNGISPHPSAGKTEIRDLDEYVSEYADLDLIIAKTKVFYRSAFVKAVGEGAAVTELKGRGSEDALEKSKKEISSLYNEIFETLAQGEKQ